MLGYRSYFTVRRSSLSSQSTSEVVLGQVRSWLNSKGYQADLIQPDSVVDIAPRVQGTLVHLSEQSGNESTMFVLREDKSDGVWLTQIIVHDPTHRRGDPWVWLDIVGPDDKPLAAAPRVARMILEVAEGFDGGARLDPRIATVGPDDVDELVMALQDRSRRGPVFVAGSAQELPIGPWRDFVRDLLRNTTGLAAGYVLDVEATAVFAEIAGSKHAVMPGTLRTFGRVVRFDDPADALRHRFLTTDRLVAEHTGRLLGMLGAVARDLTLTQPVPPHAARVETRLRRRADEAHLVSRSAPLRVDQLDTGFEDRGALSRAADSVETDSREPNVIAIPPPENLANASLEQDSHGSLRRAFESVARVCRDFFGRSPKLPDDIEDLAQRAREATALKELLAQKAIREDIDQDTIGQLRAKYAEADKQLDELAIDLRIAEDDVAQFSEANRRLRQRLAEQGDQEAWGSLCIENTPPRPESFAQLLDLWTAADQSNTLHYVHWTGDDEAMLSLDQYGSSITWAGKAWDALLALEDKARLQTQGQFAGSVHQYLLDTPSGSRTFPANKHAPTESEQVQNNREYSEPRMRPVPTHINPAGRAPMWAHFKIANYRQVSPRLHYLDATGVDGRIYVGYLGEHLPTGRTN